MATLSKIILLAIGDESLSKTGAIFAIVMKAQGSVLG